MAQLVGVFRIGRDAEVRYAGNGDPVAGLSLAFNFYDKNADKNRGSQWIEAALFGKRAESLAQYLTKGSQVYAVINDPHIETYEKRDGGGQGFKLVGKITEIELIGGRQESGGGQAPQRTGQQAQKPAAGNFDDLDSDIPF